MDRQQKLFFHDAWFWGFRVWSFGFRVEGLGFRVLNGKSCSHRSSEPQVKSALMIKSPDRRSIWEVYDIKGTSLGSLLSGDPTIWGSILEGPHIFVNSHLTLRGAA